MIIAQVTNTYPTNDGSQIIVEVNYLDSETGEVVHIGKYARDVDTVDFEEFTDRIPAMLQSAIDLRATHAQQSAQVAANQDKAKSKILEFKKTHALNFGESVKVQDKRQ